MVRYHFRICDLELELLAAQPLAAGGDMPLFFSGGAQPDLTVDCRALAALPEADGELRFQEAERVILQNGPRVSRCRRTREAAPVYARLDYHVDLPGQISLAVREADWSWATDHLRLWSTLSLPQLLLPFRVLIFHASYIQHDGRAILFTAPSRTGKSTQAELWRVHRGAQVINGDKAGVRLDGAPMAHGVPFSGTSGICRNVSLPLEAIVVLSQAPVNTVRRLPPSEAAAALCGNVFVDHYIPEEWQQALNLLLDLVAGVPVYALACTPDVRAVEALEQAMAREGREKSPVKEAAP